MSPESGSITRRIALLAGGLAAFGLKAEERNTAESANVQLVTDFCAAMATHDLDKVMSFFADNGSYRVTETQEPAKGKQAVTDRIKGYLNRVEKFEILETFARGPMVFNQRVDHFNGGALRAWHGMGVFFLKDGKIVEWYDYTISVDRG
jgi:limonene-1,2-epoxide hydrolase